MASYTIEIKDTFDLPREQVFAVFADHETFGKLLGAPIKRVRDSDQADPNGIGSVRKIGIGPLGIEETVVGFEPESLIEYTITSASPLRHHMGRIRFDNDSNGHARVRYTITFEDLVPFTGGLIQKALEQAIRKGVQRVPKFV
ncbi:SRPBCC family protein [Marinobacter sp. CHS3-4]|uniref:SRPBCC family protein n=1 Tax=Marinobacter sp. CHS3-4 TaxID=3045174 RepID=UPI0024B4EDF2|nr:SRPBCC family protein [Marinobacter sp. CHS3-4]MDI9246040.1 SRPBCC family protein [Marinobacter sp. CHS3-4]